MPVYPYAPRLLVACLLCAGLAGPAAGADLPADGLTRAVKLEIDCTDGSREMASAVPIGDGRLVTNCHAVRSARTIRIIDGAVRWPARLRMGDDYRDLCQLEAPGYTAPPPPLAGKAGLRVGMPVYAVGYTHGELAISRGQIKGLHSCSCADGRVIQTSAPFDLGASGGGLYDDRGRLLGILTFRAPAGGDYHFALPLDWLSGPAKTATTLPAGGQPFWGRAAGERAYFLTACALGAKQQWPALAGLAEEWTAQEPANPESWMALGRARLGLAEPEAAAAAFQRAWRLDDSHDDAVWELQKLEFDLGRDLLMAAPLKPPAGPGAPPARAGAGKP